MNASHRMLGLFGGTFDPVHYGHLRMALELRQKLAFDDMSLLPCHLPPHREQPGCHSADRAAMARLAVAECPHLGVDERELRRNSPSYTVDTLEELRHELGAGVSLSWCVGMDSLASFNRWYRWRDLLSFSHLVVVARPGWEIPREGELGEWVDAHMAPPQALRQSACGALVVVEMSLLDISATAIRAEIQAGRSPQFLLPDPVWRYIQDNQLYFCED